MSRHHKAAGWNYRLSQTHSKRNRATLPALCIQGCGRMITPDLQYGKDWENGHIVDLSAGGSVNLTGPAHVRCNRAAGGKRGAALTNGTRRAETKDDQKLRPW